MNVIFYGKVTGFTNGDKSFVPESPNLFPNLRVLLDELGNRYNKEFSKFLTGSETCVILVNGKGIMLSGGLDTPINKDDKIEILPFVDAG